MVFYSEINKVNFLNKLTVLETALTQRQLINDRLEVVTKSGFRWTILCLLSPFFSFFCKDAFSHVRVNNVAKSILAYFKANQKFLDEATINSFKEKFLNPLNKKNSSFSLSFDDLEGFLPLPSLKWPTDLKILGLTSDQKTALERAFLELLPATFGEKQTIYCSKKKVDGVSQRKLQRYESDRLVKEIDIPITVMLKITTPKKASAIILWTKVVIDKGGQRKVKRCYDLLTGNFLVRKKCCSKIEELILRHFQNNPSPGIEPVKYLQPRRAGFKSVHIVQTCFEGTFFDLIPSVELKPKDVYPIMHQLATGLSALHAFTPIEIKKSYSFARTLTTITTTLTYPKTFHLDIKPANILIRRSPDSDGWEAVLSDFGVAGHLNPGTGTIGYLSPEDVKFKYLVYPNGDAGSSPAISEKEIINKTLAYSQKKDVWALGLVFTSLLTKRLIILTRSEPGKPEIKIIAPPLECILDALDKGRRDKDRLDIYLADLQQESVDQSIAELKAKTPEAYAYLWDNLISKMLQVDPVQRISANDVLQICEEAEDIQL